MHESEWKSKFSNWFRTRDGMRKNRIEISTIFMVTEDSQLRIQNLVERMYVAPRNDDR